MPTSWKVEGLHVVINTLSCTSRSGCGVRTEPANAATLLLESG